MKARPITLFAFLSTSQLFAASWQEDESGIFNNLFNIDIDYTSVDASSGASRAEFHQSVGNVIDYWQELLGNVTPSERINVHIEFTDTGALGQASTSFNSNIVLGGKVDSDNGTYTLYNYTPYETSYGLQYNYIANSQAKLQGYAHNTSRAYGDLAKLAALNFGSSLDENLWRLGAHSELCKPKKLQIIAKMRQKACCNA